MVGVHERFNYKGDQVLGVRACCKWQFDSRRGANKLLAKSQVKKVSFGKIGREMKQRHGKRKHWLHM